MSIWSYRIAGLLMVVIVIVVLYAMGRAVPPKPARVSPTAQHLASAASASPKDVAAPEFLAPAALQTVIAPPNEPNSPNAHAAPEERPKPTIDARAAKNAEREKEAAQEAADVTAEPIEETVRNLMIELPKHYGANLASSQMSLTKWDLLAELKEEPRFVKAMKIASDGSQAEKAALQTALDEMVRAYLEELPLYGEGITVAQPSCGIAYPLLLAELDTDGQALSTLVRVHDRSQEGHQEAAIASGSARAGHYMFVPMGISAGIGCEQVLDRYLAANSEALLTPQQAAALQEYSDFKAGLGDRASSQSICRDVVEYARQFVEARVPKTEAQPYSEGDTPLFEVD